jgi:asparagine synthase (glutamine-hydrolysing)
MCGIAGIVGAVNNNETSNEVRNMLEILARRGPDDEGIKTLGQITLGHRRLAVFDLSPSGHQPMLSEDGRLGIVFNGAIYNFQPLRKDLESKGHRFHSRSDTEVLLNGYREWGIDGLLSRIDGMFAFGLWDENQQRLFLARDRLGVKPLCFLVMGGKLAFASTVRALRAANKLDLDEGAVAEFLEFGFITDELAIYSGVEKVHAGEVVEWSNKILTRRKYWDLSSESESPVTSFDEAVDETERIFLAAVEKRLHADVPVGALLSGGIDSSLVCWAISQLGADITAYTVGTPNDPEDEAAIAAQTAKQLGIRHNVLNVSSDVPPDINNLVAAFSEPFACASALGMLRISEEAKRSVTVLLTGDGGDDVFLGYPEHRHFQLSGKIASRLPEASTGIWRLARRAVPRIGGIKRAVSLIDYSVGGLGAVGNARDGLPFYHRHDVLGDRLKDVLLPHRTMEWKLNSGRNLLSEFLIYDRQTRFTGEYLPKVDGATMFYALEARSPFLDSKLWEFASKLPFSIRLNGGASKAILREIARRRLGETLAGSKKKGFAIPVQRWITGAWRAHVESVLNDSILAKEGWIKSGAAVDILKKSGSAGWAARQVWFLYVLESWLRYERDSVSA